MMRGSRSFWSMNAMMSPPAEQNYCLLPYQDPPLSWSQLLLDCCRGESYASEEEKHDTELIEGCWEEEQIGNAGTGAYMAAAGSGCMIQSPAGSSEVIQSSKCSWSHQVLPPSISTLSNSLLEFSNNKSQHNSTKPADSSSECNSTATGGALKKARVQGSFTAQSTLKVRKEKLGDRITALHQIVSPFGKTDTASVLLEAIDYIRFLQSQIEALTSPYLSSASGNMKQQPPTESRIEEEKDLTSRGLCLIPLPFISHAGRDFGGNYWGSF